MKKRCISVILLLAMVFTLTPCHATELENDYQNHWAGNIIEKWKNKAIISGFEDGSFKPDAFITKAEFCSIVKKLFCLDSGVFDVKFSDVKNKDWFYDAVACAMEDKLLHIDDEKLFNPDKPMTREEAAYAIAKLFDLHNSSDAKFQDDSLISDWAKDCVYTLYGGKYISGKEGNKFDPKGNLTRAELLAIINNTCGELINEAGTYEGKDINGNLVINTEHVTLKNMNIKGNTYVTEGTSDYVKFENVIFDKDIYVSGSNYCSLQLINCKFENIIVKSDKHIIINNDSSVGNVNINNNCELYFSGSINNIYMNSFADVTINGNVNTMSVQDIIAVDDEDTIISKIDIEENSVINNLYIKCPVEISGEGLISGMTIASNNVIVEQSIANYSFEGNDRVSLIAGKIVESNTNNVSDKKAANSTTTLEDLMKALINDETVKAYLEVPDSDLINSLNDRVLNINDFSDEQKQLIGYYILNYAKYFRNSTIDLSSPIDKERIACIISGLLNINDRMAEFPEKKDFRIIEQYDEVCAFLYHGLGEGLKLDSALYFYTDVNSDELAIIIKNTAKFINDKNLLNLAEKYTVSGIVKFADGTPAKGAKAYLDVYDGFDVQETDENGHFEFQAYSKYAYGARGDLLTDDFHQYKLEIHNITKYLVEDINIDIVIQPVHVLLVKVFDKNNQPVKDLRINQNVDDYAYFWSRDKDNVYYTDIVKFDKYSLEYSMWTGTENLIFNNIEEKYNYIDEYLTEIIVKLNDVDITTFNK